MGNPDVYVSEFLRKKVLKESRKKKKQINAQEQITNKVTKKPIRITCISGMEEFCMFCLQKRQQFSPVVLNVCAVQVSNRRCKPGD